jgi:hypothetical protein
MSMTLTIGWWVLPLAVTIAAFTWALWGSDGGTLGDAVVGSFFVAFAAIISLSAWLIWSLLT